MLEEMPEEIRPEGLPPHTGAFRVFPASRGLHGWKGDSSPGHCAEQPHLTGDVWTWMAGVGREQGRGQQESRGRWASQHILVKFLEN